MCAIPQFKQTDASDVSSPQLNTLDKGGLIDKFLHVWGPKESQGEPRSSEAKEEAGALWGDNSGDAAADADLEEDCAHFVSIPGSEDGCPLK